MQGGGSAAAAAAAAASAAVCVGKPWNFWIVSTRRYQDVHSSRGDPSRPRGYVGVKAAGDVSGCVPGGLLDFLLHAVKLFASNMMESEKM